MKIKFFFGCMSFLGAMVISSAYPSITAAEVHVNPNIHQRHKCQELYKSFFAAKRSLASAKHTHPHNYQAAQEKYQEALQSFSEECSHYDGYPGVFHPGE